MDQQEQSELFNELQLDDDADIQFESQDIELVDDELTLDEDIDSLQMSGLDTADILLANKTFTDVAPMCNEYASACVELQQYESKIREGNEVDINSITEKVPNEMFPYFDTVSMVALRSAIGDVLASPDLRVKPMPDIVQHILKAIQHAVNWLPGADLDRFENSVRLAFAQCTKLHNAKQVKPMHNILTDSEYAALQNSRELFEINSTIFFQIKNIVDDLQEHTVGLENAKPFKLAKASLGKWTNAAFEAERVETRDNGNSWLVYGATVANIFYSVLLSDETLRTIHVTEDAFEDVRSNLSSAELVRRLAFVDSQRIGTRCSEALTQIKSASQEDRVAHGIDILAKPFEDSRNESILADLMMMLLFSLIARRNLTILSRLCLTIDTYMGLASSKENYWRTNIIAYRTAEPIEGGYKITYVDGDEVKDFVSPTVLCRIVGDRNRYRLITPYVDKSNGATIIPPRLLVNNLLTRSQVIPASKSLQARFEFLPDNELLRRADVFPPSYTEPKRVNAEPPVSGNEFLATLNSYPVNFEDDLKDTEIISRVKLGTAMEVYAFPAPAGAAMPVMLICKETGDVNDPYTFESVKEGGLVLEEGNDAILTYTSDSGETCIESFPEEEVHAEKDCLPEGDAKFVPTDFVDIDDTEYDNTVFNKQVRRLCSMSCVSYSSLRQEAQECLASSYYLLLGLNGSISMLGSRILKYYADYIKTAKELDGYNLETLKHVLDFTVGPENNIYKDATSIGKDEAEQAINYLKGVRVSGSYLLERMAGVNLDILALQILSNSKLGERSKRDSQLAELYVLEQIPGVGEFIRSIEDRMVLLRAVTIIGDGDAELFSASDDVMAMICLGPDYAVRSAATGSVRHDSQTGSGDLTTTAFVLEHCRDNISSEEKLAIMSGNVFEIAKIQSKYGTMMQCVSDFLSKEDIATEDLDQVISQYGFDKALVDRADQFFADNRLLFAERVESALACELAPEQQALLVRYDVLRNWGDIFLGSDLLMVKDKDEQANEEGLARDAYAVFAGRVLSVFLTYAPLTGETLLEANAGTSRAKLFAKHSEDFCLPPVFTKCRETYSEYIEDLSLGDSAVEED